MKCTASSRSSGRGPYPLNPQDRGLKNCCRHDDTVPVHRVTLYPAALKPMGGNLRGCRSGLGWRVDSPLRCWPQSVRVCVVRSTWIARDERLPQPRLRAPLLDGQVQTSVDVQGMTWSDSAVSGTTRISARAGEVSTQPVADLGRAPAFSPGVSARTPAPQFARRVQPWWRRGFSLFSVVRPRCAAGAPR